MMRKMKGEYYGFEFKPMERGYFKKVFECEIKVLNEKADHMIDLIQNVMES